MQFDAKDLRDFYRTPLGQIVRRQLASRIRGRWKRLNGQTLVGVGFAAPFLGSFRAEAARVACFMPARQGALVWPQGARCHSVLVEEHLWPLPDNSVDRLLAVHCIEQAERVGPLLREAWRVLAPDGRLLIIVPNRRGLWSRIDATPFGQGLPFSRTQLERLLTDGLFTPIEWSEALYFPPFDKRMLLRMAPTLERSLARMSFGVAGVIIVEARKEIMAPVGGGLKAETVRVLRPSESINRTPRVGV
ncbi:MAG: methyltransferase domain-containing protein [Hyphomicrobium sp.]|jgi:SAM-dependent methyltransferase|nr:methyltransferase domain-containing protein [Hyphomicrobium sp.]